MLRAGSMSGCYFIPDAFQGRLGAETQRNVRGKPQGSDLAHSARTLKEFQSGIKQKCVIFINKDVCGVNVY